MFWLIKFIHDYRIKKSLSNTYYALTLLHQSFFGSYLKQENLTKQYKKLYQQQIKFIKALQTARHYSDDKFTLVKIENLHEVICSLHLLRFRFNEFALFEVCFKEMQDLQKTSTILLQKMTKKIFDTSVHLDTNEFMNAISAFENLYSNTLQVVARDPSVFQFFIQDLYALHVLIMSDA